MISIRFAIFALVGLAWQSSLASGQSEEQIEFQFRIVQRDVVAQGKRTKAKVVAEPKLIAISGQTASFQAGGKLSESLYGCIVNFTPTKQTDGSIRVEFAVKACIRGGMVLVSNDERRYTRVLKDGQRARVIALDVPGRGQVLVQFSAQTY